MRTTVPSGLSGNTFLAGLAFAVPGNFLGGIKPVKWSGRFASDTRGVTINWQWGAAVYSSFGAGYIALGVKPVDDKKASTYKNADHAATPENFKTYVVGGGTGAGGTNYTGAYGGKGSVKCS